MASRHPLDIDPEAWFSLAVCMDQNRAADEAFQASYCIPGSAWKSSLKTGKKPRPDRDQTTWDRNFAGTGKDRNRGPVFGLSGFLKFRDREKTGLTGLNQSLQPQTKVSISTHCQLIITLCRYYTTDSSKFENCLTCGNCWIRSSLPDMVIDGNHSPTISSCLSPRRMPLPSSRDVGNYSNKAIGMWGVTIPHRKPPRRRPPATPRRQRRPARDNDNNGPRHTTSTSTPHHATSTSTS